MLSGVDRKKLKSKVSDLKDTLIRGFTDHATTRYYLAITNPEQRIKELKVKNPVSFHEWELIQKKLETTGMNLEEYIKERSYTYLNRTFFLMRLEILGIQKYPVFKGMKNSSGWKEFSLFCPNLCKEEDEGYLFLTKQVSDYYARELPGLFLDDSADRAFGIPRQLIFELFENWNESELEAIFKDDTTAGWIYQYWNDPDRDAINERVKDKGKVSGKEIASATQLFTERYMVEWLIQNSLGNLWLAVCRKNQWKTTADDCIANLKKRRGDHNQKIAKKSISEDTPLPIQTEEEEHWKYYLERELTQDEIDSSISSIHEVKLLDPACGSGHFLLYAFYFLIYLYQEEDRIKKTVNPNHVSLTNSEIAKSILENNLHGIDLDPRAVQIAVASLYTTAKRFGNIKLSHMNLVATRPSIGSGSNKETLDSFVEKFCSEIKITPGMVRSLIELLGKSDVLGSLLQIRSEIQSQIASYHYLAPETEDNVFNKIEEFVKKHDIGNDLGIFMLGRQMSRGLRLLTLLDQKYDVVVANPPYLGMGKLETETTNLIQTLYPLGKEDLLTVFMNRGIDFLKENGYLTMITMHNWMFLSNFQEFREFYLKSLTLTSLAHMGRGGGFTDYADFDKVMQTTMFVFSASNKVNAKNPLFIRLNSYTNKGKEISLLNQPTKRIYHFDQRRFADIEGGPMIYWWTESFREWYLKAEKVGDNSVHGMTSGNNSRFVFFLHEIPIQRITLQQQSEAISIDFKKINFVPYVKGAKRMRWFESLKNVVKWRENGMEIKKSDEFKFPYLNGNYSLHICNEDKYLLQGIAYSYTGVIDFYCRLRKYQSIFDVQGSSIFVPNPEETQVALSSRMIPYVSQSLNPTIVTQVGDIKNLPIPKVEHWKDYIDRARVLYDEEFSRDETNIEYEYRGEV